MSPKGLLAKATARPWIRPWGALYVHSMGSIVALDSQANLDLVVYAVNHIEAVEQRLREAKEDVVRLTRLLEKCERQRAFLRSASEEGTP